MTIGYRNLIVIVVSRMKEVLQFLKQSGGDLNNFEQEKWYFWRLGKLIIQQQLDLTQLSWFLQNDYGNLILVSKRNLHFMVLLATIYPTDPIPNYPDISWYQHILILKSKTTLQEKKQLLEVCKQENWTTDQLKQQIRTRA